MAEAARPVNSVQVFGRKVLHDESWFEPDTWSNERDARYDSIPLWRREGGSGSGDLAWCRWVWRSRPSRPTSRRARARVYM